MTSVPFRDDRAKELATMTLCVQWMMGRKMLNESYVENQCAMLLCSQSSSLSSMTSAFNFYTPTGYLEILLPSA